jgi:hypothetical protein
MRIRIGIQRQCEYTIRIRYRDPESVSEMTNNTVSGPLSGSALNQCGSETIDTVYKQINTSLTNMLILSRHPN